MNVEEDKPPSSIPNTKAHIHIDKPHLPATGDGDCSRLGFWKSITGIYLYGGRNVPVSPRRLFVLVDY